MNVTVTTQAGLDAALADKADVIYINAPDGVRLILRDSGSSHPSEDEALRNAGLCRVEDVSNYLLTRYPKEIIWQEFYEKFGGAK